MRLTTPYAAIPGHDAAKDYWPLMEPIANAALDRMMPHAIAMLGIERAPLLAGNYPRWGNKSAKHRFQMLPVGGVRTGLINIDAEYRTSDVEIAQTIAGFLGIAALYQRDAAFERRYRAGTTATHEIAIGMNRHAQIAILRAAREPRWNRMADNIERAMLRRWFAHPHAQAYAHVARMKGCGASLADIIGGQAIEQ